MTTNHNTNCMQTVILQSANNSLSLGLEVPPYSVIAVNLSTFEDNPSRPVTWAESPSVELAECKWTMPAFLHLIFNRVPWVLLHPPPSWEDICLQRLAMRHLPVHPFWHILHMLQEAEAKLHWWVIKNSSQRYYYLLHFQFSAAADYTA